MAPCGRANVRRSPGRSVSVHTRVSVFDIDPSSDLYARRRIDRPSPNMRKSVTPRHVFETSSLLQTLSRLWNVQGGVERGIRKHRITVMRSNPKRERLHAPLAQCREARAPMSARCAAASTSRSTVRAHGGSARPGYPPLSRLETKEASGARELSLAPRFRAARPQFFTVNSTTKPCSANSTNPASRRAETPLLGAGQPRARLRKHKSCGGAARPRSYGQAWVTRPGSLDGPKSGRLP